MHAPRRWAPVALGVLALSVPASLAACGGDEAADPTTVSIVGQAECQAAAPGLVVDQIHDAVATVERQLGPVELFEVNANEAVVNVIVATEDATVATAYRVAGGQVEGGAPQSAKGATFTAGDLHFDPERVLSCVARELPDSRIDLFEVLGTSSGTTAYTVFVTSSAGGQLAVSVDDDGTVTGVDPL